MIRSLLVDDEPIALRVLQSHCDKIEDVEVVAACSDGLEARRRLLENTIDLVFLDIEMPGLTGIEFIEALDRPPRIIFTTAYRDYAATAFDLDAVDYLVKPVSLPRFLRAVDRYRRLTHGPAGETSSGSIHVRVDRRTVRVDLDEVLYIESLSDYVQIRTDEEVHVTKMRISDLEEELHPHGFIRIHRSFLISPSRVDSFTSREVVIAGHTLPISRSYRKHALDALDRPSVG